MFFSLVVVVGCRAPARGGSDAISLLNFVEPASRLSVTLQGQQSEVITLPLGTKLAFPVEIQPGTVLEFSLALLSGIDPGDGVEFRVYVEADGKRARAFNDVLMSDAALRWNPRRADLTRWAGKSSTLTLETRRAKGASGTSEPMIGFGMAAFKTEIHSDVVSRSVSLFNEWSRDAVTTGDGLSKPHTVPVSVKDTKFSYDRGFYDHPFELTLTTKTPNATLVYTTDGSRPNLENGKVGNRIHISRTTVVRAIAYKEGMTPTNVDTQTYIFPGTVREQKRLPYDYPAPPPAGAGDSEAALAPRSDLDVEIDPDVVSAANNEEFVEGLTSIPTLSLVMDADEMFHPNHGLYFDRFPPVRAGSVELLYPSRRRFSDFAGLQIDCAVKTHSLADRIQKRSLRLVFNKDYGPGKLRYPFFESAVHHAESAVSEFDTIVLRAGGQANWSTDDTAVSKKAVYVRDQHLRDSQLTLSGLSAHGIFVHLYLNGIYWGVYNAVERPDQRFLASYLGGEPYSDWIAVNPAGPLGNPPPSARFEDVREFAWTHDLSQPENYEHMKTLLDTSQFSDYILLNWFSGMSDWGKTNWYAGIRVNPAGRCMYFCWDSEITYDLVKGYGAPGAWVDRAFVKPSRFALHKLWQSLDDSPDFRLEFADRVHRASQNGSPLSDEVNQATFRELSDYVEKAMLCESARWGDSSPTLADKPRTLGGHWVPARDDVLRQMEGNAARFIRALREHDYYPSIDPPTFERKRDRLVIARPDGAEEVFFTTDGSDPRSSHATSFSEVSRSVPFSLELRARARRDKEWSALHEYGVWQEP